MPFKEVVRLGDEDPEAGKQGALLDGLKTKLFESEKALTGADLDESVNAVIQELKTVAQKDRPKFLERVAALFGKGEKKKSKFILVDEFDERALALFAQGIQEKDLESAIDEQKIAELKKSKKFDEELYNDQVVALERVKNAFTEKLQAAISQEKSLSGINYSDILLAKTSARSSGKLLNKKVKFAEDLNKKEFVAREEQDDAFEASTEQDKASYEKGRKRRLDLGLHPNIVETLGVGARDIVGKLELTDMGKESREAPVADLLTSLRGCLDGALYFEKNGLVIEDISLENCGMVRDGDKVKGVLFDLDRVIPIGSQPTKSNASKPQYLVPENFYRDGKTSALQMTFQFGRTISVLQRRLQSRPDVPAAVLDRMRDLGRYATTIEKTVGPDGGEQSVYPELKHLRDGVDALLQDLDSLKDVPEQTQFAQAA